MSESLAEIKKIGYEHALVVIEESGTYDAPYDGWADYLLTSWSVKDIASNWGFNADQLVDSQTGEYTDSLYSILEAYSEGADKASDDAKRDGVPSYKTKEGALRFKLNEDVKIGSTVISEGSIVEVIEDPNAHEYGAEGVLIPTEHLITKGNIMKFRLNQDVRIGSTVINEGSIVEVIEEKDRVASTEKKASKSYDGEFLIKYSWIREDGLDIEDSKKQILDIRALGEASASISKHGSKFGDLSTTIGALDEEQVDHIGEWWLE